MTLPRLYPIVDHDIAHRAGWSVPRLATAYLAGGAKLLQIRTVQAASGELLAWCDAVVAAAGEHDARVIVNDRVDIARLTGATGVHLGQDDLTVDTARELLGAEALVGLSTHNTRQLECAATLAVSYVAVGPVYDTSTKDTGYQAVGLDLVRAAAGQEPRRPVVAIGGITLETAHAVFEAGASAVAVISDLLSGGDPERCVREYLEVLS